MTTKLKKATDTARVKKHMREAIELRIKGLTINEIKDKMGVSRGTAHGLVKRGLEELSKQNLELAATYRDIQLARIEEALKVWRPISLDTSRPDVALSALDRVQRLEIQLMKLMGTETPVVQKVEQEITIEPIALEFVPPADFLPPPDATLPPETGQVIEGVIVNE